ncbi:MAG: Rieske 2Fe-2S domain-containing protein [Nitrososphaerota archaeon]|nr:Rieske 2Fe-2S domain-containing protein [Candidatus Bathyarchaeota archaeon]MDW8023897.1 Rieske 2Fe-2S domain-containing protein [Nitrososphaerota archaeon]
MHTHVRIAKAKDVPKNGMRLVKVDNLEVLLLNVDGDFYAFDNRCPHMGYPLFFGKLEGQVLTCGFHYAKFDVKSGKPLNKVTEKPLRKIGIKKSGSAIIVDISS